MNDFSGIEIPSELIAQHPLNRRDECRLLLLDRKLGDLKHLVFKNVLSYISEGDLLVFNDTKVVNARLEGQKETGGRVELFLLRSLGGETNRWKALVRGKNIRPGQKIKLLELDLFVLNTFDDGSYCVEFADNVDVDALMDDYGKLPLPPYIKRDADTKDHEYYQTVFARSRGSVASPTASLHFTEEIINKMSDMGIKRDFLTLHVGYGTFMPVRDIDTHIMHSEFYSLSNQLISNIKETKKAGKRVWAVGTTVVRALESAFNESMEPVNRSGFTSLFIKSGYSFKLVDAMITNFHHPETSLIYLVSAFAGIDNIKKAYSEAVSKKYRLLSYGDAMMII